MKYRLVFRRRASRSLADIWLAATDKDAVTRASHRLELHLRNDPLNTGESRTGRMRVVYLDPIVAFYYVDEVAGKVIVVDVRSR